MQRRLFIQNLGKYLMAAWGSTLVGLKAKALSKSKEPEYVHTFRCRSANPEKTYSNVRGFWDDHEDRVASYLNRQFSRRGLVVSVQSSLGADGRTVTVKKTYKNRASFELYQKVWKKISGDTPDEMKSVSYV